MKMISRLAGGPKEAASCTKVQWLTGSERLQYGLDGAQAPQTGQLEGSSPRNCAARLTTSCGWPVPHRTSAKVAELAQSETLWGPTAEGDHGSASARRSPASWAPRRPPPRPRWSAPRRWAACPSPTWSEATARWSTPRSTSTSERRGHMPEQRCRPGRARCSRTFSGLCHRNSPDDRPGGRPLRWHRGSWGVEDIRHQPGRIVS